MNLASNTSKGQVLGEKLRRTQKKDSQRFFLATKIIKKWHFVCYNWHPGKGHHLTYCWWTKSCTSWYGKYPLIFKDLYIQTVVGNGISEPSNRFFVGLRWLPSWWMPWQSFPRPANIRPLGSRWDMMRWWSGEGLPFCGGSLCGDLFMCYTEHFWDHLDGRKPYFCWMLFESQGATTVIDF